MSQPLLPIRARSQTYLLLVGTVVGMLAAGLAVPFLFGSPVTERSGLRDPGGAGEGFGFDPDADAFSDLEIDGTDGLTGPGGRGTIRGGGAGAGAGAGGTSGGPGGAGGPGGLGATDRGVTSDGIRLGILILDLAGLNQVGIGIPGLDPEDQRRAWRAYRDHWNERGGIHGRQLEMVFRNFDILSHDSMRAACLYLTQDQKSFSVFDSAGYWGPAVQCVTAENRTPYWGIGGIYTPDEYYRVGSPFLYTVNLSASRMLRNFVHEFHVQGRFQGRNLGILNDDNAGNPQAIDQILIPALTERGHNVVDTWTLSQDHGTAASQVPVYVSQMRSRGVDTVVVKTNTLAALQFVQAAEGQEWRPTYLASDWGAVSTNTSSRNMPRSFDGAKAITVFRSSEDKVGFPEPANDAECRQIYEQRTGRALPYGDSAYNGIVTYCGYLKLWERGALAAGAELTRDRWGANMQRLGDALLPARAPGHLAPGKFDAPDHVRTVEWNYDCTCWMPQDNFRRTRF